MERVTKNRKLFVGAAFVAILLALGAGQALLRLQRCGVDRQAGQRGDGHEGERGGLERELNRVEKAERGAGVVHARQVEEAGDDADALMQIETIADERLCRLVDEDDGQGNGELEWPESRHVSG